MPTTPNYDWPIPALSDGPNGPSQIQALGNAIDADFADTGWLTTPGDGGLTLVMASGWAIFAGTQWRKVGVTRYVLFNIQRTGAAINANPYNSNTPGNISDTTVCTLSGSGWSPNQAIWGHYTGSTTSGSAFITAAGLFQVVDAYPSSSIDTGDVVKAFFSYPV